VSSSAGASNRRSVSQNHTAVDLPFSEIVWSAWQPVAANRRYRMATCLPWPSKSVTTVAMKCLHLRHSNIRLSKPFAPRAILAKLIRVRHFGQIGRWIAAKDGRDVSLQKASGMDAPLVQAGACSTLSHR
jgi:hypothetical protein